MKKINIFGVSYAVVDYESASCIFVDQARSHNSYAVFALPVHGVIEIRKDSEFLNATRTADMIVPDGQPIKWAMNYLAGAGLTDRVYGPVLLLHILRRANAEKLSVFLYGGRTPEVQQKFKAYINEKFPDVIVSGIFREESAMETTLSAADVNTLNPHIVIVGLGCPNQEKWIARNKEFVNAAMIGVGAAFSFYSGDLKMAPRWMQDNGLEWLYRLVSEPRRLWKRYLYTNSYFLILLLRRFFRR